MEKLSVEGLVRIYIDATGEYIEVCPDADSLGMLEVRQCNRDSKITDRLTITREQAKLLSKVLIQVLELNPVQL